jgi:hypothetical protein
VIAEVSVPAISLKRRNLKRRKQLHPLDKMDVGRIKYWIKGKRAKFIPTFMSNRDLMMKNIDKTQYLFKDLFDDPGDGPQ